jgi:hypothetical protein
VPQSPSAGVALVMLRGSRPAPTQDRPPWWLAGATRLLLLAEGLGWWAVLIVAILHNGRLFLSSASLSAA